MTGPLTPYLISANVNNNIPHDHPILTDTPDVTQSHTLGITDNMRDAARVMSWITQDILPRHRWVVASTGHRGEHMFLKLVGLKKDGTYDELFDDGRNDVGPEIKGILESVLGQYMQRNNEYGRETQIPLRLQASDVFNQDRYSLSVSASPLPSLYVKRNVQIPVLSDLFASFQVRFNREALVEGFNKRGIPFTYELGNSDLKDLRRKALDIYPVSMLAFCAPEIRKKIAMQMQAPRPADDSKPGLEDDFL